MADPTEEKALYVGEGGNCLTDGTPLIPHETIALVSAGEAEHSEIWEPISGGAPASSGPRNAPPTAPGPSPSPPPSGLPDLATPSEAD